MGKARSNGNGQGVRLGAQCYLAYVFACSACTNGANAANGANATNGANAANGANGANGANDANGANGRERQRHGHGHVESTKT